MKTIINLSIYSSLIISLFCACILVEFKTEFQQLATLLKTGMTAFGTLFILLMLNIKK